MARVIASAILSNATTTRATCAYACSHPAPMFLRVQLMRKCVFLCACVRVRVCVCACVPVRDAPVRRRWHRHRRPDHWRTRWIISRISRPVRVGACCPLPGLWLADWHGPLPHSLPDDLRCNRRTSNPRLCSLVAWSLLALAACLQLAWHADVTRLIPVHIPVHSGREGDLHHRFLLCSAGGAAFTSFSSVKSFPPPPLSTPLLPSHPPLILLISSSSLPLLRAAAHFCTREGAYPHAGRHVGSHHEQCVRNGAACKHDH